MDGSGADLKPVVRQTSSLMCSFSEQGTIRNFLEGSDADQTEGVDGQAETEAGERVYDHPKLPAVYDHPRLPPKKSRFNVSIRKHLPSKPSKPRALSVSSFRIFNRSKKQVAPAPNSEDADFQQATGIVPSQDKVEKTLDMENVPTVAGMPVDTDLPVSDATGGTPVGNAKAKPLDQDAVVEEC